MSGCEGASQGRVPGAYPREEIPGGPEPLCEKTNEELKTESLQKIVKGADYFNVKTRNRKLMILYVADT